MNTLPAPESGDMVGPKDRFAALLDSVYPHLNALHGTAHSRRFWAIILHRFLRKCLMVDAAGHRTSEPPFSPGHDNAILGPMVGEGPSAPATAGAPAPSRRISLPRSSAELGERLTLWRLRRTPAALSRSLLFGFHYFHEIGRRTDQPASILHLRSGGERPAQEPSKREAIRQVANGLEASLTRLALEWLPAWYVEEFRSRFDAVALRRPKDQAFHASFLHSVEGRFHIARHVEEGASLTLYQHAGTYGEIEDFDGYQSELSIADRYRTWGWQLTPKDSPFLALRLMKPAGAEIQRGSSVPQWLYINVRDPFPWWIPDTLRIQETFFERLSAECARKVLLRPRILKGGSTTAQVSPVAAAAVSGIDGGTLPWTNLASHAEVVVLDSFPTTLFLECLQARLPVVAIVPDDVVFSRVARPFYDEFERVGVLHRTPEAAAAFLSTCSVDSWWREIIAKAWFREYLDTFCRTDDRRPEAGRTGAGSWGT